MLNVSIDTKAIENALDNLFDVKAYKEIGNSVAKDIEDMVYVKHTNVHGSPLEAYEPKYEKWKIKKGLSGSVNFLKYNQLWRSMTVKTLTNGFKIYFNNASKNDIKMGRYGLGNHKNWLIFTWEGIVLKSLQRAIDKRVNHVFNE